MPSNSVSFPGLCLVTLASPLAAQCAFEVAGSPQPHLSGLARCSTAWDPDGTGPLPTRLVVGGGVLLGGSDLLSTGLPSEQRVMAWDGSRWEPLGTGPGGGSSATVHALISWNGELFAAGDFVGGTGIYNIARWDGTAWQSVGGGRQYTVLELTLWNGNLVAAGAIFSAGTGTYSPRVSRWDGTAWTDLPMPPSLTYPRAMASFEGELIVAGAFGSTQGVIERWNGSSWGTSIVAQGGVHTLGVRANPAVVGADTLFVGGSFTTIGGAAVARIARTSGGATFTWNPVGSGVPNQVLELHVRTTGLNDYVVVAAQGDPTIAVSRFTGSSGTWSALGAVDLEDIDYFAGSYHAVRYTPSGEPACFRHDGLQWMPVRGQGIAGVVHAATPSGDDLVVGGTFATVSGVAMNHIARWNGTTYAPLGSGMVGTGVEALVTLADGDIVAGGSFVTAGGTVVNNIARWDGTTWSAMGTGMDAPVKALCQLPNGDVIAGGAFTTAGGVSCSRVARWNGTAWSPMHFGMNDEVLALCVRGDGTLFAGGRFTIASTFSRYHVAYWTGSVWGQVGAAMNDTVHGLAARPNGDIVAVGEFTQASLLPVDRIARWNGSTWLSMGAASAAPGIVRTVFALPDGDVLAGHSFGLPTLSASADLSRWSGSTWYTYCSFSGYTTNDPIDLRTIVQRADGAVVVGGSFHVASFTMAHALAALQTTCLPTVSTYGTGCSSAAGLLTITADSLPFVGATLRTTTTGVATGSLCLGVIGLSQLSLPLDALLAGGQPGCSLLASPDILMLSLPDPNNEVHSAFAIGDDPALIGLPFFWQTVPFEFDGSGALAFVRGSNALALVIGSL